MSKHQKLLIIISRTEKTQLTARRIKRTAQNNNVSCKILFLEEITLDSQKSKSGRDTVIFFLTNHPRLGLYAEYFSSHSYSIINEKFSKGERSKLFIQHRLATNNISVPANKLLTDYESSAQLIKQINFPIYIKSQNQMHTVLHIKNHTNLKRTVTRLQNDIGEWYIEKDYENKNTKLIKISYVYGKIYVDNKLTTTFNFSDDIARFLQLDIFSADVIIGPGKKYWAIDINPAPGLYKNTPAREAFVKNCFNYIKK